MRFILRFVLIIAGSYLSQQFFGWWSVVVVAFLIGLLLSEKRVRRMFGRKKPPALAFFAGFLALFLLWGGMAFFLDMENGSLLSAKIYEMIFKPVEVTEAGGWWLIALSAVIGGVLGGLGAMTGNLLGEAIKS